MSYSYLIDDRQIIYHQQDEANYCGAACIQMLLHSLTDEARKADPTDQNKLFSVIDGVVPPPEARETGTAVLWAADPGQLTAALNHVLKKDADHWYKSFKGSFQLEGESSADGISMAIVSHIEAHHVAAIALVYGLQHWLLVRGFTTDVAPASGAFQILAFDLYDPSPAVPTLAHSKHRPPPHIDGKDDCGSGSDRGVNTNHVTYDEWLHSGGHDHTGYMTGIPPGISSTWSGQFVAICDPQAGDDPVEVQRPDKAGRDKPTVPSIDTNDLETQAIAGARAGVQAFDLLERPDWQRVFPNTTPRRPYRVERLDAPGLFYFVVPFEAQQGTGTASPEQATQIGSPATTPVAIKVDGPTGRYQQGIAAPSTDKNALIILDVQDVLGRLVREGITLQDRHHLVQMADIADKAPPLVWKPCIESFSAFIPFYAVSVQTAGGVQEIFIRALDGQIFTELHDNVGGA